MTHLFRSIALTFAIAATSLGATTPQPTASTTLVQVAPSTAAATAAPARPALWKVADEDTTIYLFGTIHALPGGIDWLHGNVAQAIDRSQELVTEITDGSSPELQARVMGKAMLTPGKSLRDLLNEGERKRYEAAIKTLGLPESTFDAFKPWYAAVGLATLPLVRSGYSAENGVEEALEARIKPRNLPHSGLETMEFQLGLFDGLPPAVQKRYLMDVIDGLPQITGELDRMVAAWKAGDADRLASIMNEDEEDPAMMEALITNRNRAWAQWVQARLARPGTVFVAVGAGHLAGDGSVQAQLAAKGLTTQRVQ